MLLLTKKVKKIPRFSLESLFEFFPCIIHDVSIFSSAGKSHSRLYVILFFGTIQLKVVLNFSGHTLQKGRGKLLFSVCSYNCIYYVSSFFFEKFCQKNCRTNDKKNFSLGLFLSRTAQRYLPQLERKKQLKSNWKITNNLLNYTGSNINSAVICFIRLRS